MRVLVITKRQYTNGDLLDDRFGRLREIPLALARLGHDVRGLCLSYAPRPEGEIVDTDGTAKGHVLWYSRNAGRTKILGLIRFIEFAQFLAETFKPAVILACSDSFYGIIGIRLAKKARIHCVFDLYDNFESFASTSIPGVLSLYRHAVRAADGVTCVSDALKGLITEKYGRTKPTLVVSNAIQTEIFHPRDKNTCRHLLGLPADATIIGTAGALHRSRGIRALLEGFQRLAARNRSIHLAVAGPRDGSIKDIGSVFKDRVHDLGILPAERVPLLLNSLDVAAICNRDSAFGRYCFPQKAYEIMACRVPLVAANVGAMKELLASLPDCLFDPNDPVDFVRAVEAQLRRPQVANIHIPTWDLMAEKLEALLEHTVTRKY